MKPARLILVLMLGVVLVMGCDNVLQLDRNTEIQIGQQGAANLERQYGTVNNPAELARLSSIGKRLAVVSEGDGPGGQGL